MSLIKGYILLFIVFPVFVFASSLYVVDGQNITRISDLIYWKGNPFVQLKKVADFWNIKWSVKDGMGVAEWNNNFISFNTSSGEGLYDAIYALSNAASNANNPLISVASLSMLLGANYTQETDGIFMIKRPPALEINGAILYGHQFTIFFNAIPPDETVKVSRSGILTDIKVFPVKFSPNYVHPNSPLVVERDGNFSVEYLVTFYSTLTVKTSTGTPTLPVQNAEMIDFGNGILYKTSVSTLLSGKVLRLKMIEIPSSANLKVIKSSGTTTISLLGNSNIAIVGFESSTPLIYANDRLYGVPSNGSPLLTWNGQKFDIIETDQVITVNIGNIPFVIDGINSNSGNVILYTAGQEISNSPNRLYVQIKDGRVISTDYIPRANGYVLSINKSSTIFWNDVKIGQIVNFFLPFYIQNSIFAIQGKTLMIQNSSKMPLLNSINSKDFYVIAAKGEKLYFIYVEGEQDLGMVSDILLNMGFSDAFYLGENVFMIVDGKIVNGNLGVGLFWIEIDKTTGGVDR
ncbi:hypothetical protein [Athalassotoga saccharophila]|uniref:hypothetical protein n=1 Tax=Athalassotoga saccharophila TaxID=1441386 RepID=UPI00137987AB|nr:hypothetical protein [Athalassotoga saccharophila]BBJ27736.1 hypothetical protein ATHSA_0625 [Athalassotoga saccharophila]